MDYKVKYEQAIADARAIIKNYEERHLDDIAKRSEEDISAVFPELKESEDESIRKELIKGISKTRPNTLFLDTNVTREDAISWLEKQGTPAKLSEEEQNRFAKGVLTSCAMSFIDYLDAHKYEGKMCVSNGECEDIENAFHNAMWDRLHRYYCKYIEKQGEQKESYDTCDSSMMDNKKSPYGEKRDFGYFEKQGEQKPNPYSGTSFEYNGHTWGMCARDNGVELLLDGELKAFLSLEKSFIYPIHPQPELAPKSALEGTNDINDKGYCFVVTPQDKSALEVINEEKVDNANKVEPKDYNDIDPHFGKPIDKVVPKFKVGDTIKKKSTGDIVTVNEVNLKNKEYRLTNTGFIPFKYGNLWELVEQKPADKIEPKFHEGDLVVCEVTGSVYQIKNCIENLSNHKYGYDLTNGGYIGSDEVNHYHLWNIADAKDGDVLAAHECLVLFREIDGLNIRCHCTYHFMNNPSFYVDTLQNKDAFHPATKEQRDLLFQKMHEEGYEWDAKKKGLKHIEQEPAEKTIWYDNMYDLIADAMIDDIKNADMPEHCKHNRITWINRHRSKPTEWSEEDKDMLRMLLEMINYASDHYQHDDKATDIKAWVLKSLKDRVGCEMNCTTTKEWSEEDEEMIKRIKEYLNIAIGDLSNKLNGRIVTIGNSEYSSMMFEISECISWLEVRLKSLRPQSQNIMSEDEFAHIVGYLVQDIVANEHMPEGEKQPTRVFVEKYYNKLRPQNRWKPSEEQIQCLYDAIEYYQTNGYPATKLKELHEQMQKIYKL